MFAGISLATFKVNGSRHDAKYNIFYIFQLLSENHKTKRKEQNTPPPKKKQTKKHKKNLLKFTGGEHFRVDIF